MGNNKYLTTDKVFNLCVSMLNWGAYRLGTTYKSINVWIFVVIMPIIGVILLGISAVLIQDYGFLETGLTFGDMINL